VKICDKYKNPKTDIHFIGIHATFRWKHRLIEGFTFKNLKRFNIEGFLNVIDDINTILKVNSKNPKWDRLTLPNLEETQNWMLEEEFVTQVIADVFEKQMFIIARNHNIENLFDLFFSNKKKIYLSYPIITSIKNTNPELLDIIQNEILKQLEDLFVVFNPLTIKDMSLTNSMNIELPDLISKITNKTKDLIKTRTVERDFRFIDQSDAIVVLYQTDKLSIGVISEIIYAHRNQKPVYMLYDGSKSPFLENYTTFLSNNFDDLLNSLKEFSLE